MRTVTVERTIAAPIEEVFDWLSDSGNYADSSPLIFREKLVQSGQGAPYGLGAIREITAVVGWFREQITVYERPHRFGYQIIKVVPTFRHHGGLLTFTETASGTHVTWTSTAELPVPGIGRILEATVGPVFAWGFSGLLDAAAEALEK